MTSNERSGLLGGIGQQSMMKMTFNIEFLRAFGLTMGCIMIFLGRYTTDKYVWGKDNNPDKVEDTYIYKVFGFAHTCVYIDYNPSKTVSAILLVTCVLPLMLYTVLNNYRIRVAGKSKQVNGLIVNFSEYTWGFRFFSFAFFFMVFVNSPYGEFTDPQTLQERFADLAWRNFFLHYLFFMFWQFSLALMAIEQTCFNYQMNTIPFGIKKPILKAYIIFVFLVLAYYTGFIWAHMFGFPIPGKNNVVSAQIVMYLYLVLTAIIPVFMALCEYYGWGGVTPINNTIEFY